MERRAAIEQIAEELCQGRETVQGSRIVEIIETCKLEQASPATSDEATGAFSEHFQTQVGVVTIQQGLVLWPSCCQADDCFMAFLSSSSEDHVWMKRNELKLWAPSWVGG